MWLTAGSLGGGTRGQQALHTPQHRRRLHTPAYVSPLKFASRSAYPYLCIRIDYDRRI